MSCRSHIRHRREALARSGLRGPADSAAGAAAAATLSGFDTRQLGYHRSRSNPGGGPSSRVLTSSGQPRLLHRDCGSGPRTRPHSGRESDPVGRRRSPFHSVHSDGRTLRLPTSVFRCPVIGCSTPHVRGLDFMPSRITTRQSWLDVDRLQSITRTCSCFTAAKSTYRGSPTRSGAAIHDFRLGTAGVTVAGRDRCLTSPSCRSIIRSTRP